MPDHVYRKLEVVGSSSEGLQQAIENAVTRAGATVASMRWFEVVETRGYIEGDAVAYWQVTVKIGYTLDDE